MRREIAAAVALMLVAVGLFTSSGHDDSHITYWAAHSLASTGRLLDYDGEVLEQSSALATTVALAALDRIAPSVGLPAWGEILSLLAGAGCVLASARLAERVRPGSGPAAAALVATQPALVYWSASGLETSLATLSWTLWALAAGAWLSPPADPARASDALVPGTGAVVPGLAIPALGVLAATTLVAMARPESPYILAIGVAAAFVATAWNDRRWAGPAWLAASAVVACGALFAWRHATFAAWFPAPVAAKTSGRVAWDRGALYVLQEGGMYTSTVWLATLGAVVALGSRVRRRETVPPALVLAVALVLADVAFAVRAGGDWMGGARFLVPSVGVGLAAGASALADRRRLVTALVVGAHLAGLLYVGWYDNDGRSALATWRLAPRIDPERRYSLAEVGNVGHARDILLLGVLDPLLDRMRAATDRPLVLFSGQAGMVPFYLFQRHEGLVYVDANSLTTTLVSPCLPKKAFYDLQIGRHFFVRSMVENAGEVERRCGVGVPDVVWDAGKKVSRDLDGTDYVVVYVVGEEQRRELGDRGVGSGWIAVRPDWAAQLGLTALPRAP